MQTASALRRSDCEMRRAIKNQLRKEREAAIKADNERTEKMNAALEEAQAVSERYCLIK